MKSNNRQANSYFYWLGATPFVLLAISAIIILITMERGSTRPVDQIHDTVYLPREVKVVVHDTVKIECKRLHYEYVAPKKDSLKTN